MAEDRELLASADLPLATRCEHIAQLLVELARLLLRDAPFSQPRVDRVELESKKRKESVTVLVDHGQTSPSLCGSVISQSRASISNDNLSPTISIQP